MRRQRKRSSKPRRESKTIRQKGEGDDNGVWFSCWYCGWTNKKGRNELGGPHSQNSFTLNERITKAPGALPGEPKTAMAVLVSGADPHKALKSDSAGNEVLPTINYLVAKTGCSLCGSLNWRGDHG
ncbi:MAG: hypothetical protein ACE5DX_05605 [Candidatus Dojkabacteria bacterium]